MTVRELIQFDYDQEQQEIEVAQTVARVLKAFEGKLVTKRFATAVEKELGCIVSYDKPTYGSTTINIWGKEINRDYEHRMLFFFRSGTSGALGLDGPNGFTLYDFMKHNICHYAAAQERQDQRKEQLDSDYPELLLKLISQYDHLATKIEDLTPYTDPSHYSIQKEFSLKRSH